MATRRASSQSGYAGKSRYAGRSGMRNGAINQSVTGINIAAIQRIKAEIDKYITHCKSTISVTANSQKIQKAIKGTSSEQSLKQLNNAMTEKLKGLLDNLQKYDSVLDTVASNYRSNDTSNASFTDISRNLMN